MVGRELGPADSPALDEMTRRAMADQDRMRSILKSVAMSEPFLHKGMQDSAATVRKQNDAKKDDTRDE